MELFNAVKEKAADLSLKAAKKSGEFVQTVKSNFTIADKQAEKSKLLKELGSMVFDAYKKGEACPDDQITSKCVQLDQCDEDIEYLRKKLRETKHIKICPDCSTQCPESAAFCSKCGAQLED